MLFISVGFCWCPNEPINTSPSLVTQTVDVQYDNFGNLTFSHSVCCRFILSASSRLRVIVTVDILKWLLMAQESLHSYCLLVLGEHFTINATSLRVSIFTSGQKTDLKHCKTKQKNICIIATTIRKC